MNCELCGESIAGNNVSNSDGVFHPECAREHYRVTEAYRDTVFERYQNNEDFDHIPDAEVSLVDCGAWVKVWAWVPKEEMVSCNPSLADPKEV